MRVTFWGTRGSIAKAGPTTVRYGGNTSCVEVVADDGTRLVLDCGTGAHGLGHALIGEGRRVDGHILISHTHWDHIQGIPFFAPLFERGNEWHIYGPRGLDKNLREILAGQMEYAYFPVTIEALGASIDYRDLVEGHFEIGGVRITSQYLNHPALTMGYRIEADGAVVVYSTDHEPHSRELAAGARVAPGLEDARHREFIAGADLLIHDAQYTAEEYPEKRGWGHSTVEYAIDSALAVGVRRLALFHHDPLRDDDSVDALVERAGARIFGVGGELEVFGAREGLTLELRGERARTQPAAHAGSALLMPPSVTPDRFLALAIPSRSVYRRVLAAAQAEGFTVRDLDKADEVVACVSDGPAAVLLGRGLAGDGTLALCERVRQAPAPEAADVPLVVISGSEHEADRDRAAAAGVTESIVAPVSDIYLRTRLRAWLLRRECRWVRARLADDEPARIDALRELGILGTEPEERFDRYTWLACSVFNVPIALVGFVDSEREWFKAGYGDGPQEVPRDVAFCAYTILGDDVFTVNDTLDDDRFAESPVVTGMPRVRFYAGVPLVTAQNQRVGALCLLDQRPRELGERELAVLRELGRMVQAELKPARD